MPQTAEAFLDEEPRQSAEDFLAQAPQAPSAEAFLSEDGKVARMAAGIRSTLGVVGRAVDATKFAIAGYDAPDVNRLDLEQPDESSLLPRPKNTEPRAVRLLPEMAANFGKAMMTGLPFPRVTSQEVADALSYWASTADMPQEYSDALRLEVAKPGNLEKIIAGAQRAAVSVPEAFTSPFGVATIGAGALPGTAGRVVAGGFAVDMASHIPEQVGQLKDAIASGDPERITETAGNLLATGAMTAATTKHALTKPKTPLEAVAPLTAEAVAKVNPEPTAEGKPGDVLPNPLPPVTEPLWSSSTVEPGKAIYLSTRKADADAYSLGRPVEQYTPTVRNTFDPDTSTDAELVKLYDAEGGLYEAPQKQSFRDALIAKGYDSIKGTEVGAGGPAEWLVVLDPAAIKATSATPLTTEAVAKVVEPPKKGFRELMDEQEAAERKTEQEKEAAGQIGELKGYTPAIRLEDGTVVKAANRKEGHGELDALYPEQKKTRGFVNNETGQFLNTLEIAREQMQAKEPAPELPPAKPEGERALTAEPVAKVQAEVSKVAAEEGQRSAKEIKSELVSEIEKAITAAPNSADVEQKFATKVSGERYESQADSRTKVTIDIPGDGKFTVWNTKEALGELLTRAKRLKTDAGKAPGVPRSALKVKPKFVDFTEEVRRLESERANKLSDIEDYTVLNNKVSKSRIATLNAEIKDIDARLEQIRPLVEKEIPPSEPQGAIATPGINTGVLGEMGMGGAKPGEFAPGRGTATGIKNAVVDSERQARGQPPILAPQRLANPVVWDAAMARIDNDPGWQDRLIDELKDKPRTPSAEEIVALDHRYVDLQNEYAKATRDGAQHYKDGFQDGVKEASERAAFYEGKLNELEQVARKVGTEWGRSGQMRQRLLNEDFSLAAMEARARASKGFEPLTAAEHTQIAELHAKLAEAQRKAGETEAANAEKVALLEAQKALAEAKAAAATAPLYEPRVLQAAEKFAKFMDKKGDDALARIKARLGRTSAGIDPTILSDVGILGAAKITRGVVDFARWTDLMVRDLGDWFREHAQEGWDTAQAIFVKENESFHKGVDRSTKEKIRRAKDDISGRIGDARENIKAKSGEGSPLHSEVKKLVRLLVEQDPSISRDSLIDTIHDILKESIPEITRIEAMDAISGRGRFWTPPQDEVSKTVRDLSTQIRLVGHQMDVEARKPLPRTGYQPEKLTDVARREQQKLNELKRRYGVVVTDPAAQLGSVLNARKTYYTHRISDLQAEISARERIVKNRSLPPTDAALEALKSDYARVKAEHDEIFPRQPLTDAQRLERAISAAERNEKLADEKLTRAEKGDFSKAPVKGLPPSIALNEIRARTAALREETKLLKDLATPKKTPEEIALQTLRTRLATEKADLTERLAKGDFSPRRKAPRELTLDPATAAAKAEVTLLKEEFNRRLEKHKYELKSRLEKIWLGAKEALNLSRAILTSWDVSAVFRQGGFIAFGNPIRAARALGPMFDALRSDKRAAAIEEQIKARPNSPLYEKSKLFLAPREGKLTGMEEAFMSRLAGRIPGIAASQRAYVTFLNRLRADTFDALHESLVSKKAATPEELKAISNYINAATGRGNLGSHAAAAETLATVFFSPRLVASRFQLLAGQPLYRGSAATRFLIAKEYAKFLVGLAAVYGLSKLACATVSTDSNSSDFGKLKFGNTRVDPLGGLSQVTVLLSRLATGEKTNAKGKSNTIVGNVPYGKTTLPEVMADFLRSKLSPVVGSAIDLRMGKNVVGEPVSAKTMFPHLTESGLPALGTAFTPLAFNDIYEVMLEQGVPAGTAIGILSLFGMSVQNYDANRKRPK